MRVQVLCRREHQPVAWNPISASDVLCPPRLWSTLWHVPHPSIPHYHQWQRSNSARRQHYCVFVCKFKSGMQQPRSGTGRSTLLSFRTMLEKFVECVGWSKYTYDVPATKLFTYEWTVGNFLSCNTTQFLRKSSKMFEPFKLGHIFRPWRIFFAARKDRCTAFGIIY